MHTHTHTPPPTPPNQKCGLQPQEATQAHTGVHARQQVCKWVQTIPSRCSPTSGKGNPTFLSRSPLLLPVSTDPIFITDSPHFFPIASHQSPLGPVCLPASPPPPSCSPAPHCVCPLLGWFQVAGAEGSLWSRFPGCLLVSLPEQGGGIATDHCQDFWAFVLDRPPNPPVPAKKAVQGHASHTPAYIRAPYFNGEFSLSWHSSEMERVSDLTKVKVWNSLHLHPLKLCSWKRTDREVEVD